MRIIDCEQGSQEWLNHKLGVVSGTRTEGAFKGSEPLINKLIAERMATYTESQATSKDMDRGNALEPLARKEYEKITGLKVEQVGFILHPDRDDIGISPDGIISGAKKAVEFKCPKSATHIEYMRSTTAPKKYLFQLASYFLNIPTLKTIDFVSYDELNEVKPIHILTLSLDDILSKEYLKGKTIGSMNNLESKIFSFADKVANEYERLIF